MQPDAVSKPKGRGRPKTRHSPPRVFSTTFSWDYPGKLSKDIAHGLGIDGSSFTNELAHIALAYGPLRDLQKRAKMKKGCTRRSKIHLQILLRDVAITYARYSNADPRVELKKINGYREERLKDANRKKIDIRPPVEILARAVMALWGDEVGESLQRHARAAVKLI